MGPSRAHIPSKPSLGGTKQQTSNMIPPEIARHSRWTQTSQVFDWDAKVKLLAEMSGHLGILSQASSAVLFSPFWGHAVLGS